VRATRQAFLPRIRGSWGSWGCPQNTAPDHSKRGFLMVNKNSNIVSCSSSWPPHKHNMKLQSQLGELGTWNWELFQRAMTTLRRRLPQFLLTFMFFYEPVSKLLLEHNPLAISFKIIFKLVINCIRAVL